MAGIKDDRRTRWFVVILSFLRLVTAGCAAGHIHDASIDNVDDDTAAATLVGDTHLYIGETIPEVYDVVSRLSNPASWLEEAFHSALDKGHATSRHFAMDDWLTPRKRLKGHHVFTSQASQVNLFKCHGCVCHIPGESLQNCQAVTCWHTCNTYVCDTVFKLECVGKNPSRPTRCSRHCVTPVGNNFTEGKSRSMTPHGIQDYATSPSKHPSSNSPIHDTLTASQHASESLRHQYDHQTVLTKQLTASSNQALHTDELPRRQRSFRTHRSAVPRSRSTLFEGEDPGPLGDRIQARVASFEMDGWSKQARQMSEMKKMLGAARRQAMDSLKRGELI